MSPGILYGGVSIDIGEKTQAESVIVVIRRVGEPVNNDGVVEGMVDLPHPAVQLVVGDAAPVLGLLVIVDSFSAIPAYFQIMRREFCVFCVEPLQPTQGSWLVPLEPPKSPKRGPF